MKCIKHTKTGNIIRIADTQADQLPGRDWLFVPKSEWKSLFRGSMTPSEQLPIEAKKGEHTKSAKHERAVKLKLKQRQ